MMIKLNRTIWALSLCALGFFATGCEAESDRKLASAQECMDQARNAAAADICMAKVSGDESAQAYRIRCTANFVAQGFTGTRVSNAFNAMRSNTGTDPMVGIMAYMVFNDAGYPTHSSANARTNCARAGVVSLARLADMAKTATMMQTLSGLPISDFSPTNPSLTQNMKNAIQAAFTAATNTDKETIGQIALSMQASLCSAGSSYATNEACSHINTAVSAGGGNAVTIGTNLLTTLNNRAQ